MAQPPYLQENKMAVSKGATKSELIKELKARGFVMGGEFSQNAPLMEAIAAAMVVSA